MSRRALILSRPFFILFQSPSPFFSFVPRSFTLFLFLFFIYTLYYFFGKRRKKELENKFARRSKSVNLVLVGFSTRRDRNAFMHVCQHVRLDTHFIDFQLSPGEKLVRRIHFTGKIALTGAVFLNNLLRRHAYYRIFSRVVKKKKERKRGGRKRKKVLLPAYGVFVKKPAEHWFLNFTRIKHSHCSFRVEKNLCWRNEREKKR